ncbi:Complement Receptor Type 2 [Manis pentadactyla]|nr:Complement Receptor Type 2 [Manis pentadactyla]
MLGDSAGPLSHRQAPGLVVLARCELQRLSGAPNPDLDPNGNKCIENIQSEKPSSGVSTACDGGGNGGDNNGCNDSGEVMVVIVKVIFMLVLVVMTKVVMAMLIMVMVVKLMRP